ncbi:AzlC family ABC transporter permease [Aquitalea denitrificans]|uniref:AzlC family ABC transporter permease n=1 Tax=Aquitalea denitrificans TaxID=519081 RepID=UPI00135C16D5|nr:AzlC family ABC transporter permease [Aquitalea denitrificans]
MTHALNRRALLLEGARDTVPMLVGAAPFGVIFGTLAIAAGLSPATALGMSVLVFAGSSQFIGVSLIGAGTALPVLWLTTFVVNLRHALYSATLLPYARDWPLRWRWPLAFWLTDETFAVVEHRFRTKGTDGGQWYWLASSLAMYGNWLFWTMVGVSLGQSLPGLATLGLDFAMGATFAAIVAPQLKRRPALGAALAASVVAMLGRGLPYKLDLMLAAVVGVASGLLLEQWNKRKEQAA